MGIDGFGTFLRKKCPSVYQKATKSFFVGRSVAVDMHLLLYQMFHRNGGVFDSVLRDVQRFCSRLKADRITATLVFDGKTTGLKPRAHQARKEVQERDQEKLCEIEAKLVAIEGSLAKAYEDLTKGLLDEEDLKRSEDAPTVETGLTLRDNPVLSGDGVTPGDNPALVGDGVAFGDNSTVICDGVALWDTPAAVGAGDVLAPGSLLEVQAALETSEDVQIDGISVTDIGSLLNLQRQLESKEAKVSARLMHPSQELFDAVKELLKDSFGEDAVVVATDDGERHVAELCATGAVDFAVSSDYDTLAFGAPNLVIDFASPEKTTILRLEDVLNGLKLENLKQFQDFCILCGCDFCEKVPGIGPVTALKSILQYKTIESMMEPILSSRIKKQDPSTFSFDYEFARARYAGHV